MSSRLLRGADAGAQRQVAAMNWRLAGGTPRAIDPGRAFPQDPEPAFQMRLEAARHQGFVEGEAAAAGHAAKGVEAAITALRSIANELAQQRQRVRNEAEEDLVKLALAIARRILHRELSIDPEAMLGLVKAAALRLNSRETHRLRVAPDDAKTLREFSGHAGLAANVEIIADASLARGGAVFETARGELDASVDTQLHEIERGLTDVLRRRLK